MLVLSRKENEEFLVTLPNGETGRIVIGNIKANRVSVGFDFPNDVKIIRTEVLEKENAGNLKAKA